MLAWIVWEVGVILLERSETVLKVLYLLWDTVIRYAISKAFLETKKQQAPDKIATD